MFTLSIKFISLHNNIEKPILVFEEILQLDIQHNFRIKRASEVGKIKRTIAIKRFFICYDLI